MVFLETLRPLSGLNGLSCRVRPHRAPRPLARWLHDAANGDKEPKPDLPVEHVATIRTLDPAKLTALDYADISRVKVANFACNDALKGRFFHFFYPPRRFPPNTGGFLYVHRPPEWAPPLAYEIRFRVTNNDDPSSFASGHDLRYGGLPWGMPLIFGPYLNRVSRRLMVGDGIIEVNDFKTRSIVNFEKRRVNDDRLHFQYVLWALRQPFRMDLSVPRTHLTPVYTSKKTSMYKASNLVTVSAPHTRGGTAKSLFSGSMIARFEPSERRSRLNVRVLKITSPIVPRGKTPPYKLPTIEEGGLLPKMNYQSAKFEPYVQMRGPHMTELPDDQVEIEDL